MRDRISGWSARGWERVEGDRPQTVALREQVLSWLGEVPEPHQAQWERRLRSDDDRSFRSVVLELFLHHSFKAPSWKIAIEPELSGTRNRPDFLLTRDGSRVIVEAKVLLDVCQLRDTETVPVVYHNPNAKHPLADEVFLGWQHRR